jgi:Tol biopolymer transport system component
LTTSPAYDDSPAWLPDGRLSFVSNRDGNLELYVLSAECVANPQACTSGIQRLTQNASLDISPAWSPIRP